MIEFCDQTKVLDFLIDSGVWVFCCGCGGLRLGLWWSLFGWIFWWRLWFWLRAISGFGFLIHSDFLMEVVVVLRAVGGGGCGCGCGFLGLPLMVVVKLG